MDKDQVPSQGTVSTAPSAPPEGHHAFDAAWVFIAAGPLCLELQKTAHTNTTNYFLDAASGAGATANPPLSFASYGAGCKLSSRAANMTASGTVLAPMNWPSRIGILRVNGTNGPANSFVIVFLGGSNTSAFGIPLPFLLPGSAAAPSGPCNLYTSMLLIQGTATTANGASTTDFAFPATPELNGIRTFEQILALDPAANPSGIVLSNGVNHNIVAPYGPIPGARVFLTGGLGPTGTVGANFLLVTRFNS